MLCVGSAPGRGKLYLIGTKTASLEAFPNLPVTDSQWLDAAIPGVVGRAIDSEVVSLESERVSVEED